MPQDRKIKKPGGFKIVMWTTAVASSVLTVLFFVLSAYTDIEAISVLSITFLTIAFHFDVRLLIGYTVPHFKRFIRVESGYYKLRDFELKLYRFIGVKRWKSKVPTYDPDEFDIRKNTPRELIVNTCNSEIVHTLNVIISFVPIIFAVFFGVLPVFIITSVLASIYDLQFVILQRYNRPRIARLIKIKDRRG